MSDLIRELLMVELILQLIQGLLRLITIAFTLLIFLALVGGECFGGICIPEVVNLRNLPGTGLLQVAEVAPEAPKEGCPQFQSAFPQLLPKTWSLKRVQTVNVDGDIENECLAIYQYNAGNGAFGGPLGGVVYDPQPDRDPKDLGAPVPYRPAAYVPYHLLPREDGKGFLSERFDDWDRMFQIYDANGDGYDELIFQGYSSSKFSVYLSIFEWQNTKDGFRLMTSPVAGDVVGGSLWGDAGISITRESHTDEAGNEILGPIEKVTVKTRPSQPFWYFRSQLCYAHIYRWNKEKTSLEQQDYYLTFCFGRPNDVETRQDEYALWYPEEALLAWYKEGEVREISLPAHPVGNTVQATVTLRQGSQQRWLATWNLRENTDGQVQNMTFWYLEQVGEPYDP